MELGQECIWLAQELLSKISAGSDSKKSNYSFKGELSCIFIPCAGSSLRVAAPRI